MRHIESTAKAQKDTCLSSTLPPGATLPLPSLDCAALSLSALAGNGSRAGRTRPSRTAAKPPPALDGRAVRLLPSAAASGAVSASAAAAVLRFSCSCTAK
jgi:hypothetical protein